MLFAYILFVLLCILLLLLYSPVVIRYTKDTRAALVVHFVFFSVTLMKKAAKKAEKKPQSGEKKSKKENKKDALLHALRYAFPRATVSVQSLPMPAVEDPFFFGIALGGYYTLVSLILSLFGRRTSDPLLSVKKEEITALDVRFEMRFYAFLHTFLVYLTQYKKEKNTRSIYGRNENE